MEEYFLFKERMEEIEREQLRLAEEQEKTYQEMKGWGIERYTLNKREEVIQDAIDRQLPQWVIEDLRICHTEWEEKEISHIEVIKFATYDMHINSFEKEAYQTSKLFRFHKSIFGGEEK